MDFALKLLRHGENLAGIRDRSASLPAPVMTDIDPVIGACNLDCAWCCQAASRSSHEATFMPVDTMLGLARLSAEWGIRAWRIASDSESLLHPNLSSLIDAGHAAGVRMGLITNGVLLDRLPAESLSKLTYLGVSLDATDRQRWADLKRSQPQNYDRALANVAAARKAAPDLDISLKLVRWSADSSATKADFGPLVQLKLAGETRNNFLDAEELPSLASKLGVRAIVREAYPKNMAATYDFEKCYATPLGGVFDAAHRFHLCCDARQRYILTHDYRDMNWRVLPRLWGSERHWQLIDSIDPRSCAGCAKQRINEVLEQYVISEDPQADFI